MIASGEIKTFFYEESYCTEVILTLIKVTAEVDYHYVVLTIIMLYSKRKGHI